MPYSIKIDPLLLLTILSWRLSKTMRDRLAHHLTQLLPSAPDQHLTERLYPDGITFACHLTLEDDRLGREGLLINFNFAVQRYEDDHRLYVLSGRMVEEEPAV